VIAGAPNRSEPSKPKTAMRNQELAVRLVLHAVESQSADGYAKTSQDVALAEASNLVLEDTLAFLQTNSIVSEYRSLSSAKKVGFAYKLDSGLRLQSQLIDWVCNAFELVWKDGGIGVAPRIEAFIDRTAGQLRAALLRELVKIDVEYRHDAGDSCTKQEYILRFPAEQDAVEAAWQQDDAGRVDSSSTPSRSGVPSVDEISNRLPHLKNLELVGQGGMGVVYRAPRLRLFQRGVCRREGIASSAE
jgi:hypothetical protein